MLKSALRRALDRFGLELVRKDAPGRFVDPFAEIKHLGRPIRMVFDVGANVGDVTRRLARDHPAAIIHAFEPAPDTFATLQRRTADLANVHAHAVALGAKPGQRMLRQFENSRLSTLADTAPFIDKFHPEPRGTVSVETTTLDAFAAGEGVEAVDLLKIDTEGLDYEVLTGGAGLFANRRVTFVVCEFNEVRRPEAGGAAGLVELHDLLAAWGFRLFMIQNDYVVPDHNYFAVRNALFVLA
jgi:FkbM family methyltransferase